MQKQRKPPGVDIGWSTLFGYPLQCRQQYRQQQGDDSNHYQKLYKSKSRMRFVSDGAFVMSSEAGRSRDIRLRTSRMFASDPDPSAALGVTVNGIANSKFG
jgi:hypothetical protein